MGPCRKLESTESALAKHPLADAPDLDTRLEYLARKQAWPLISLAPSAVPVLMYG